MKNNGDVDVLEYLAACSRLYHENYCFC